MKKLALATILCILPCAASFADEATADGWTLVTNTDPFTDEVRTTAILGNIVTWCEPRVALGKWKHLEVAILTDRVPEGRLSSHGRNIGLPMIDTVQVPFQYRFDTAKSQNTMVDVAEDHQGIVLCVAGSKHCAKTFAQKMYAASKLIYQVDVVVGGSETEIVSLVSGKDLLKGVMDECGVKPKTFRNIGSSVDSQ